MPYRHSHRERVRLRRRLHPGRAAQKSEDTTTRQLVSALHTAYKETNDPECLRQGGELDTRLYRAAPMPPIPQRLKLINRSKKPGVVLALKRLRKLGDELTSSTATP